MQGHTFACGRVVSGVSGFGLSLGPLLGDDAKNFGHLGFTRLHDVVDRVVDAVGKFLDNVVDGGLAESHGFHLSTTNAQAVDLLRSRSPVTSQMLGLGLIQGVCWSGLAIT